MGTYMEIFEARVLGENIYLHQRFTVFKVEYFLYIIQIMLQYTFFTPVHPSKIGDFSTKN
jgi:hypothetical protein